jgi:hypothetical protein
MGFKSSTHRFHNSFNFSSRSVLIFTKYFLFAIESRWNIVLTTWPETTDSNLEQWLHIVLSTNHLRPETTDLNLVGPCSKCWSIFHKKKNKNIFRRKIIFSSSWKKNSKEFWDRIYFWFNQQSALRYDVFLHLKWGSAQSPFRALVSPASRISVTETVWMEP